MRTAPLKGDCVICQAPEPTRVAINAAIWPGDGMVRAVGYMDAAAVVGQTSGVPELAKLNRKTVRRHVVHIEESWREVPPGGRMRPDEAPVATDFPTVMEQGVRLGSTATGLLQQLLDEHGDMMVVLRTKEVIDIAKLGLGAADRRENARLKRNQQAIDVMAIFATSSGHVAPPGADEEAEDLDALRAELATERRLLSARAGHAESDLDIPPDVAAAL